MDPTSPQASSECSPGVADAPMARLVTARPEPRNAWVWIWIRPRGVIRAKIDRGSTWGMWGIAYLAGLSRVLQLAMRRNEGRRWSLGEIFGGSAAVAVIVGVGGLWLAAWLLGRIGRSIGGHGSARDLRIALCWASIPKAAWLVSFAVSFAILGDYVFWPRAASLPASPASRYLYFANLFIGLLLLAWSTTIGVLAVGEAHRFSAWRGLVTIVIGAALLLVFSLVFVMPIMAMAK